MTKLRLDVDIEGDLRKIAAASVKSIERANSGAVSETAKGLQKTLRGQVRRARLGDKLEKAWRVREFPRSKDSIKKAALVFSKASRLHAAFSKGGTITARSSNWLVIPLAEAERRRFDRRGDKSRGPRPRRYSAVDAAIQFYGSLRFVKLGGGRALLVADNLTGSGRRRKTRTKQGAAFSPVGGRGSASFPVFLLVKQTTLPKRLDIEGAAGKAERRLVSSLARRLPREK